MDPETGKFTDFWDVASHTYGLEPDRDGNIWFTNPGTGQIGRADWKTLKIKQWAVPTPGGYERAGWRLIQRASSGLGNMRTERYVDLIQRPKQSGNTICLAARTCFLTQLASIRMITFGTRHTIETRWDALIQKPARLLNIHSRIRKTQFGSFFVIHKGYKG